MTLHMQPFLALCLTKVSHVFCPKKKSVKKNGLQTKKKEEKQMRRRKYENSALTSSLGPETSSRQPAHSLHSTQRW
jgi:hypothetical protein